MRRRPNRSHFIYIGIMDSDDCVVRCWLIYFKNSHDYSVQNNKIIVFFFGAVERTMSFRLFHAVPSQTHSHRNEFMLNGSLLQVGTLLR